MKKADRLPPSGTEGLCGNFELFKLWHSTGFRSGKQFYWEIFFFIADFLIKRVMELILFLVDLNISNPRVCKNIKDSFKDESVTLLYNGIIGLLWKSNNKIIWNKILCIIKKEKPQVTQASQYFVAEVREGSIRGQFSICLRDLINWRLNDCLFSKWCRRLGMLPWPAEPGFARHVSRLGDTCPAHPVLGKVEGCWKGHCPERS